MSTTEPIIIPIEGDPSDFVKDSAKVNAELDKMAKGTKAASGANTGMASSAKAASFSITDLRSSYMLAMEAARVAGQVWQATGQEFVNYAEQVKNMSRSLGASAEETSRLIQVADDVRVSYDTLKIAMKEAQKDGIDPNIEGLAKLADQYVKLQSPTEKTKFLLDKFGKSGLEMGKLMEKGGDGIRKMSGEIDKSLIITEKGIKASDDYQAALDNWNDSIQAVKISIGSELLPIMTDLLDHTSLHTRALEIMEEQGLSTYHAMGTVGYAAAYKLASEELEVSRNADSAAKSVGQFTQAAEDNADTIKDAKEALKDYEDQLDAVSKANLDNESTSRKIAEDRKKYTEDHNKALEDQAEAQRKLNEALHASGKEGSADAIEDAQAAYDEATRSVQKLEAASMEASTAMVYDMVQAKLAVDGLTDAELKALDAYAVSKGIKSQADVDETNRRIDEANTVVEGIKASEDVMVEDKKIAEEKKRLETAISTEEAIAASEQQAASMGIVKESVDSATQSYQAMAQAAWDAAAAAQSAAGSSSSSGSSGGSSPDERDGSSVSSSSVSKNSTLNISIHNPRGENSASSVRRALKLTSYLGHPI